MLVRSQTRHLNAIGLFDFQEGKKIDAFTLVVRQAHRGTFPPCLRGSSNGFDYAIIEWFDDQQ